jgi:hypothetical protein
MFKGFAESGRNVTVRTLGDQSVPTGKLRGIESRKKSLSMSGDAIRLFTSSQAPLAIILADGCGKLPFSQLHTTAGRAERMGERQN